MPDFAGVTIKILQSCKMAARGKRALALPRTDAGMDQSPAARDGYGEIFTADERWEFGPRQRINYRQRTMGYGARLYFACPGWHR
jgi:hypothetical protein